MSNLELTEINSQTAAAKNYRVCTRCIMDTSVPGIVFDTQGVCNFCKVHDRLDNAFPLDERGETRLKRIIADIRKRGKGRKYDCIVGISGGRDSTYTLYLAKKVYGLRPLAVHFNNGFGNPVAGENMVKAATRLGVELRTITSDWREAKDIRIATLKASIPEIELGTDMGIASALYGASVRENVKYIFIGQSFRTEGITPLSWNYLDGRYLKSIHQAHGTVPLRKWKAEDPGFNLNLFHMLYYVIWKQIRVIPLPYFVHYRRKEADEILKKELDWVNTGAHYFDDLYQSLTTYVLRVKFNIDRRRFNYSALIRSGQLTREEALEKVKEIYVIEDPDVIRLCIKRLGISKEEFEKYLARPVKTFRSYPNHYHWIEKMKVPIQILTRFNLLPGTTYDKYFNSGR